MWPKSSSIWWRVKLSVISSEGQTGSNLPHEVKSGSARHAIRLLPPCWHFLREIKESRSLSASHCLVFSPHLANLAKRLFCVSDPSAVASKSLQKLSTPPSFQSSRQKIASGGRSVKQSSEENPGDIPSSRDQRLSVTEPGESVERCAPSRQDVPSSAIAGLDPEDRVGQGGPEGFCPLDAFSRVVRRRGNACPKRS